MGRRGIDSKGLVVTVAVAVAAAVVVAVAVEMGPDGGGADDNGGGQCVGSVKRPPIQLKAESSLVIGEVLRVAGLEPNDHRGHRTLLQYPPCGDVGNGHWLTVDNVTVCDGSKSPQ